MNDFTEYTVSCSGAINKVSEEPHFLNLEHREGFPNRNVRIKLNDFTSPLFHLPERLKDLIIIAGYIFAADRLTYRGTRSDLEYHSWSRFFNFHIKVTDSEFWNTPAVKDLLSDALSFLTGDHKFQFTFYKDEPHFPSNIFDNEKFIHDKKKNLFVTLFSGGIDSLSGIIERLETTDDKLCLVSHQSGQPSVINIQNNLFGLINSLYPGRCSHYKNNSGLHEISPVDENQRTRAFLFTSTAFAVAKTYNYNSITIYENGITSLNLSDTPDLINGRSSRTTHPKTIRLFEKLFTEIGAEPFRINTPFLFKTKTDVVSIIKEYKRLDTLDISVSCGHSRKSRHGFTHCGGCSQCIDRIFATYAACVERHDDNGIYSFNFLKDPILKEDDKKVIVNYLKTAQEFEEHNLDSFFLERTSELVHIEPYIGGESETDRITKVFDLCKRHSRQVEFALERMREIFDKPLKRKDSNSFFRLILDTRLYQNKSTTLENSESPVEKLKTDYKNEDVKSVSNELANAQGIILRQRTKIKTLEKGINRGNLEKLIYDNKSRMKNGKINYSALGKLLGVTHHTAKAWCKHFSIS